MADDNDYRMVSALFAKLDKLTEQTERLVNANEITEQRIMSITDDLKTAALKTADAVGLLDAKVDLLITSQQSVVTQLTAALAANTGSGVDTAAVQQAIDTLNAATASATAESGKVDLELAPPTPAPTPPAAPSSPSDVSTAPVATAPTADPAVAAQAAVATQHADATANTTGIVGAVPVTEAQVVAASPSIDSGTAITSMTPNVAPLAAASSTVTPADGSATKP